RLRELRSANGQAVPPVRQTEHPAVWAANGSGASRADPSEIHPMTKRKGKTAAELMAELNADPSFVVGQREQEQARLKMEAEFRRAEAPLIDALKKVGVHVQSVWDLVNTANPYPKAVPILIEHLQRPYPERVREGIARALAVPDAVKEWDTLRRLFETEADATTTGVKWALG